MNIRMDMTDWRRGCKHMERGIMAVRTTLYRTGRGEIVVSKRKQAPGERSAPVHGKAIANMLAKKGGDVFVPEPYVERHAHEDLEAVVYDVFDHAMRSGNPQHARLRNVVKKVTEDVLRSLLENIATGREPRRKSPRYAAKLKSMAARGASFVDTRFGLPPPWGIKTGRFFDGIKARLGRSKAALRSVYDSEL